jgi:hypothetical protein
VVAIEDGFWKSGRTIGVYNRMPLDAQDLAGGETIEIPRGRGNPYHRPYPGKTGRGKAEPKGSYS